MRDAREVHRIPESDGRPWDLKSEALRSLARALASVGEFDRAREAMGEIPYMFDYVLTCNDLAAAAGKAGRPELAESFLADGAQMAARVQEADSRSRLELLLAARISAPLGTRFGIGDIARALREEGRPDEARALLQKEGGGTVPPTRLVPVAHDPAPRPPGADPEASLPAATVERRLSILEARAALFSRTAQPERVSALLAEARSLADRGAAGMALTVAEAFLRLGHLEDALTLLGEAATPELLRDWVKRSVKEGRWAEANRLLDAMGISYQRGFAASSLLDGLIESRLWDEALALSEDLPPYAPSWEVKGRIAWSLIRAGHVERGYELAAKLARSSEIAGSVLALYARGRPDRARELIAATMERNSLLIEDLAGTLALNGLYREAVDLLQSPTPRRLGDRTRVEITLGAASRQDFDFALETARGIEHPEALGRALQAIVAELQRAGRPGEAKALAARIDDPERRAAGLRGHPQLLPSLLSVTTWLEGGMLGYVEVVARSVALQARPHIFDELSAAYAAVGDLNSAVAVAKRIPNGAWQAEVLQRLAGSLAAEHRFEEALALARDIPQAMARALELQGIEPRMAEVIFASDVGPLEKNEKKQALFFPDQVVLALTGLAIELRRAGSPEDALPVLDEARRIAEIHTLQDFTLRELFRALAICHRWRAAFDVRPLTDAHGCALDVHELHDELEALRPGLGIAAADAAAEIAAWYDEDWRWIATR